MGFMWSLVWFQVQVLAVVAALLYLLGRLFRKEQSALLYYPNQLDARHIHPTPREFRIPDNQWEALEVPTPDGAVLRGFHLFPPTRGGTSGAAAFQGQGHSVSGATVGTDSAAADADAAAAGAASATTAPSSSSFHSASPASPCTVIYFHGNAGNVSHRLPLANLFLNALREFGAHVVMLDYRGYGQSDDADVTEAGLKQDAQATLDWTLRHIRSERVFVMGTSLGAAVAVDLVARPQNAAVVAGVIVENTFTSISDMADSIFTPLITRRFPGSGGATLLWTLKFLVKPFFMSIGWFSNDAVRRLKVPTLFVSSQRDEIVPPRQMRQLCRLWGTRNGVSHCPAGTHGGNDDADPTALVFKRWLELPNGTHNDAFTQRGYGDALASFVREVIRREAMAAAPGIVLGTA